MGNEDYLKGFIQDGMSFRNSKPKDFDVVCKEVGSWSDEWMKSILPENNKLSMLFPKWDKEFKGKLRGKLVPVIGYGGSKKSLIAQNIAKHNITLGLGSVLYSTMEMGATEIISRLINMSCEPQTANFNPASELEYYHNKGMIDAEKFYKESFAPMFNGKFFITENTSLQTEEYDKLLSNLLAKGIKIDILVVDGLSGMGGSGTETELYSRHSRELKSLSLKWNVLILLMCHVSKGGKRTDRDLSDKVRSSEKIIDNCDFYISASQFESDSENGKYNKINGNFRLVNKRGSGNEIDVIYDFNSQSLVMEQTDMELKQFDDDIFNKQ